MKRIVKILSASATLLVVFGFSATAFAQGADIKTIVLKAVDRMNTMQKPAGI